MKSLELLLGRNRSALSALAEPGRSNLEAMEDTCPFGALPQGSEALVALWLFQGFLFGSGRLCPFFINPNLPTCSSTLCPRK